MSNITLSVPDELLQQARVVAAKRKTTVNAMVRAFIEEVAQTETALERRRARLRELSENSTGEVGPITWTRDELHER
jgi:ubiquinone biosynthesis protein UbiJ